MVVFHLTLKQTSSSRMKNCDNHVNEELIESLNSYKYLGVYIYLKMQWNKTVDHIVSMAGRALDLKRNFLACWSCIKGKLYLSLVCPKLEYSCKVWSPSWRELKQRMEMVHRNAACFVTNNYSKRFSVQTC